MMEIWKPIPNYEGLYDASSYGRIRSAIGKTTSNARYETRVWKTRILKPKSPLSTKRTDQRVTLWKDGNASDFLVARLVCMTFHGVPEEKMTVNHINGDWLDNRPENLEWMTISDNIKHGFRTGLFNSIQNPIVLVNENGDEIQFSSMAEASRFLGRSAQYVSNNLARGNKTFMDVDGVTYTVRV